MAYIRFYNPYSFANRDESFDSAYENLTRRFNHEYNCGCKQVPANISETDKEYKIQMALPGVDKNNINVKHEDGYLYVTIGKSEKEGAEDNYDRQEFDYSGASRVFKTGEKIDSDNISAKYENGILFITLPKKEAFKNKPAQSIVVE